MSGGGGANGIMFLWLLILDDSSVVDFANPDDMRAAMKKMDGESMRGNAIRLSEVCHQWSDVHPTRSHAHAHAHVHTHIFWNIQDGGDRERRSSRSPKREERRSSRSPKREERRSSPSKREERPSSRSPKREERRERSRSRSRRSASR